MIMTLNCHCIFKSPCEVWDVSGDTEVWNQAGALNSSETAGSVQMN